LDGRYDDCFSPTTSRSNRNPRVGGDDRTTGTSFDDDHDFSGMGIHEWLTVGAHGTLLGPADQGAPEKMQHADKLDAIPDFRFFVDLDHWKENNPPAAEEVVKTVEESSAPGWVASMARGLAVGSEHPEELSHLFSGHLSKLILVMMPLFALILTAL
jgi:hypothetical protein